MVMAAPAPGPLIPAWFHVRAVIAAFLLLIGCGGKPSSGNAVVVTLSGSAVGEEGRVLQAQIERFMAANPDVLVEIQPVPDAADQRHQLYVQWLNARTPDPDILQLDVVWTPEFAAAGWIAPLDGLGPETEAFFPATVRANRWGDSLFAIPWFVDVGLLYWRTDLVDEAPAAWEELARSARGAMADGAVRYGFLWQGARYEGLVTTFLEQLHAFGGEILDDDGRVVVDSEEAVRALAFLREMVLPGGITPSAALTWQEEQTRLSFQSGEAVFLRNWPYAARLLADSSRSKVAGSFAVAPLPRGPSGVRASALGGQQLAINAHSGERAAAWRVIEFLTGPEEMLERARAAGHYPAREALYAGAGGADGLEEALGAPASEVAAAIESAVPRPVTPLYSELSGVLQVWLHRALTGQAEPEEALGSAAAELRGRLDEARARSGGAVGR